VDWQVTLEQVSAYLTSNWRDLLLGLIVSAPLTALAILITWFLTRRSEKRSQADNKRLHEETIRTMLQATNEWMKEERAFRVVLMAEVRKVSPGRADELQGEADRIQRIENVFDNMPGWEGEKCPVCGKGTLRWKEWAGGPFGPFTAWLKCDKCGATMPSPETS